MKKIDTLRFNLSYEQATLVYEDGSEVAMTMEEALSAWQDTWELGRPNETKGLPVTERISTLDELLAALAKLQEDADRNP